MHNFGTRDRGCSAHPAFPAPSIFEGGKEFASLGRNRVARSRTHTLSPRRPGERRDPYAAADAVRKNWSRAVLQQPAPVVMDPGLRRDDGGGFRCFGANHAADAGLATDNAQKIALARLRFRDSKMRKIAPMEPLDARSDIGEFDDRHRLDGGAGLGADLRSKIPGLPPGLRHRWQLHRLQLCFAGAMRRVGLGTLRRMHRQSIFCEQANAGRAILSAAPRPLTSSVWLPLT